MGLAVGERVGGAVVGLEVGSATVGIATGARVGAGDFDSIRDQKDWDFPML